MAAYNKQKLYSQLDLDSTKNYTQQEILEHVERKNMKQTKKTFTEPVQNEEKVLGEVVEPEGEFLSETNSQPKKTPGRKTKQT